MLHTNVNKRSQRPSDANPNVEGISGNTLLTSYATTRVNSELNCNTLLPTALLSVEDANGTSHNARALLDAASQLSFITEDMAKRLKLKLSACSIPVTGINNVSSCPVAHTCKVKLFSKINKFHITVNCTVIKDITGNFPAQPIYCKDWKLPEDIQLADPSFNKSAKIDLLLGADVFFDVVCLTKRTRENYSTLVQTHFGRILSGKYPANSCRRASSFARVHFLRTDSIDAKLQSFWEIEKLTSHPVSKEDKLCEAHFARHTSRSSDGRFLVQLPVRPEAKPLGNSREQAERRLIQLKRRFKKQPKLKHEYSRFMDDYIERGHMVEVKSILTSHIE
jgi:hypothetical protein